MGTATGEDTIEGGSDQVREGGSRDGADGNSASTALPGDEGAARQDTALAVPEGAEALLGALLPAESAWRRSEEPHALPETARAILEDFRARGDCVLAYSGYLDLSGRVWGCVVCGGPWVDVCVVSEESDGRSSQVRHLVLDAEEAERQADAAGEQG